MTKQFFSLLIYIVLLLVVKAGDYTWQVEYIYLTSDCNDYTVTGAIAILMDKCIQSGTGSYKLSCSNVTDANGDFTRNTTYYTDSIHCEGKSDPSLLKIEKINSACSLKTKFVCVYNPIIEDWPGFGVWKSSVDETVEAAAEECSQEYGPDQVYALPGTCMNYTNPGTGQKRSWIYTNTLNNGDPSQYLLYYQYYNTLSCTVDSTGQNFAQDQIGPFDVCDEYVQGGVIRRQIQSKVSEIPGIVVLPYSSSVSIGDNAKGRNLIGVIVLIILIIYAICALLGYALWYYLWVYIPQKKTKELMRRNSSSTKEENASRDSDAGVQLDAWNS